VLKETVINVMGSIQQTSTTMIFVMFFSSLPGFDDTDCPVEIQVTRHSQYRINVGNSLIICCPVHYCKKKPVMEWCKIEVATCVQLKEGKAEWKSNVFTLEIFSVHQNDSGLYRCRAIVDKYSSESHGIKVIVEGETPMIELLCWQWESNTSFPLTPKHSTLCLLHSSPSSISRLKGSLVKISVCGAENTTAVQNVKLLFHFRLAFVFQKSLQTLSRFHQKVSSDSYFLSKRKEL
uniref:Ig-like domain-containing protein n=1 Tax=Strix occidentalis caurina TaxID=311401 RepID=A0A8D0FSV0_STROC